MMIQIMIIQDLGTILVSGALSRLPSQTHDANTSVITGLLIAMTMSVILYVNEGKLVFFLGRD